MDGVAVLQENLNRLCQYDALNEVVFSVERRLSPAGGSAKKGKG